MKKIKEMINKHKGLAIVTILALVLFIIMLIIFLVVLLGGSSNPYGNRLDDIENVALSESDLEEVATKIEEETLVTEAKVRIQGKIIYIDIDFENGITEDKAKEIAVASLEYFEDDVLAYYDLGYFLVETPKEDATEEDTSFVITGTKHYSMDAITWIKSQVKK